MRIKPIPFNYGMLVKDFPKTEVQVHRKNVVIDNDIFGMWGENIDPENKIMMLTSISVKREHTKNTKETLIDLWETTLNQYVVEEEPEEILARIEAKKEKAKLQAKKAEEKAAKEKVAKEAKKKKSSGEEKVS